MKLKARFLASLESRDWEMPDNNGGTRKGTTHRISLMLISTGETVALKIPDTFNTAVHANNLAFGDVIELVFAPKVVLSVVNGRAVQELKMLPDTFEFVQTAQQAFSQQTAAD